MAEEPGRRRLTIASRIHNGREERRSLEDRRMSYIERIATREIDITSMKDAIDVLRRTLARFELEIEMYRSRVDRIDARLADLERAELREFEMGAESARFAGMTIADASYELLKETGEAMHVRLIWEALSRRGLRSSAQRPTLSVTTALLRDERFERVAPNTYAIVGTQPRLIDES